MLKGFDPNRHGYLSLSSARDTMVAIAGRINEVKKQKENRERVRDLQTSMVGWKADNLSAYGELVLEVSWFCCRLSTFSHYLVAILSLF